MNFYLYSPISISPWGPEDLETGIGGIETSIAEMAWRLARLGHDVTMYIDLKDELSTAIHRGVKWIHHRHANPEEQEGIWVVYRTPDFCHRVNKKSQVWFKVEDWNYDWDGGWVEHVDRFLFLCDTHINYTLKSHPQIKDKIILTSHGVKVDLLQELEKTPGPLRYCFDWAGCLQNNRSLREHAKKVFKAGHEVFLIPALAAGYELPYPKMMDTIGVTYNKIYRVEDGANPKETAFRKLEYLKKLKADAFYDDLEVNCQVAREAGIRTTQIFPETVIDEEIPPAPRRGRNPRKMVYCSSPDRGLGTLLEIFPKIRAVVPDAELHVFYGFNGIDDLIKKGQWPDSVRIEQLKRLILDTEGVTYHGRVSQRELYGELLTAGMMVYPTQFAELNFIAGQEAQCAGAIPVVSNVWAQGETTVNGVKINGDPTTPLVKAQFVAEICRLMTDIDEQETLRFQMVHEARKRCDWERPVQQWSALSEIPPTYRKVWHCRDCGSDKLNSVVDLGRQTIATFFPKPQEEIPAAPLEVVECEDCNLTQLSITVNRSALFRGEYGYRSGINETMKKHLEKVGGSYFLAPGSTVVDIGCNDGTFLKALKGERLTKIGFDPNESCPKEPGYIRDFFSYDRLMQETGGKKVDAVFSLAMFYDLDDPQLFAQEVWNSLEDLGMWVIEVQDAKQLLESKAFDFICHEHVTNWDFGLLRRFLAKMHFQVMDHQFNKINGGSLIVTAKKCSQYDKITIPRHRTLPWADFGLELKEKKKEFREFLDKLKPARIWGYGASTKGNVLMQYYGITNQDIEYIVDRNPDKWGRRTPGTNIQIVSEEICRKIKPDYLLALPWAFIDGFREREPWAKFIVPFPTPAVFPPLGVAQAQEAAC